MLKNLPTQLFYPFVSRVWTQRPDEFETCHLKLEMSSPRNSLQSSFGENSTESLDHKSLLCLLDKRPLAFNLYAKPIFLQTGQNLHKNSQFKAHWAILLFYFRTNSDRAFAFFIHCLIFKSLLLHFKCVFSRLWVHFVSYLFDFVLILFDFWSHLVHFLLLSLLVLDM